MLMYSEIIFIGIKTLTKFWTNLLSMATIEHFTSMLEFINKLLMNLRIKAWSSATKHKTKYHYMEQKIMKVWLDY
jgi:hypothetical protein